MMMTMMIMMTMTMTTMMMMMNINVEGGSCQFILRVSLPFLSVKGKEYPASNLVQCRVAVLSWPKVVAEQIKAFS